MYTEYVSDEPLDIIRLNEAETALSSLTTTRIRRLFNEIERLNAAAPQELSVSFGTTTVKFPGTWIRYYDL